MKLGSEFNIAQKYSSVDYDEFYEVLNLQFFKFTTLKNT